MLAVMRRSQKGRPPAATPSHLPLRDEITMARELSVVYLPRHALFISLQTMCHLTVNFIFVFATIIL